MTGDETEIRKPRIAIMGEFSAGKSTLSNLLLGQRALPEKVTATRLPPVWMVAGSDEPFRVDTAAEEHPVFLDSLEDVPLEETLYIQLQFETEILDHCDLIDFPGISDPNMSSDIWERMLGEVDGVLWCTHATQAWRQSEAAVWGMIPEHVRQNSLLLITRFDKLINDKDKARVRTRVAKETQGLFAGLYPISLTQALAADEGSELWETSGAHAFYAALAGIVERIAEGGYAPAPAPEPAPAPIAMAEPEPAPARPQAMEPAEPPASVAPAANVHALQIEPAEDIAEDQPAEDAPEDIATEADDGRIIPRRVRPNGFARTARPSASDARAIMHDRMPSRPAENGGGASDLEHLRAEFRRPEEGAVSN
ncbi:MAG: dynamin family protein [Albidovulum sp.]|uniref:dynamin family protein n=1 Tax=Albidovulum sp. TaxID=1872424 RepID=UPI003C923C1D